MNRLLLAALVVLAPAFAHAALPGSDSAADGAYNAGYTNGANGGTGFGAWQLTSIGPAGFFTGSSAGNGDGDAGSNGDINTSGRAWGLYGSLGGGVSLATRPFSGDLDPGNVFSIDLDNGFIQNSESPAGIVGFSLLNNAGREKFWFQFEGGTTNYTITDGTGLVNTGIPFTDEGLRVIFTQVTVDNNSQYSVSVQAIGADGPSGLPFTHNGVLFGSAFDFIESVDRVQVFNRTAGNGSSSDLFVNSLTVVPEPGTMVLLASGALAIAALRRKRA